MFSTFFHNREEYVEIMIYTAVSQPSCFSWFDLKNLIYQETASSLEPKHNSYIPLFNFDAYFMLEELHLKCSWPISRDWSGHIWHSLPSLEYSHSDLCLMISFGKQPVSSIQKEKRREKDILFTKWFWPTSTVRKTFKIRGWRPRICNQ